MRFRIFSFSLALIIVCSNSSRSDADVASDVQNGWKAIKSNDFDTALSYGKAAVRSDPNSVDGFLLMGWSYLLRDDGHNNEALEAFSNAIRLNKDSASAYHGRARCYWNKGMKSRAIDSFSEAIRLDPKNPSLYQERGDRYMDLGDKDAAIADYKMVKTLREG